MRPTALIACFAALPAGRASMLEQGDTRRPAEDTRSRARSGRRPDREAGSPTLPILGQPWLLRPLIERANPDHTPRGGHGARRGRHRPHRCLHIGFDIAAGDRLIGPLSGPLRRFVEGHRRISAFGREHVGPLCAQRRAHERAWSLALCNSLAGTLTLKIRLKSVESASSNGICGR